jgi:hypothetical protein
VDGSERNQGREKRKRRAIVNFFYRLIATIQETAHPKGKIPVTILRLSNEPFTWQFVPLEPGLWVF